MIGGYVLLMSKPTYEELLQEINELKNEVLRRKEGEKALREKQKVLRVKVNTLKELNTSLRVLLQRREDDVKGVGEKVLSNVKLLVIPFLDKLHRTQLDPRQRAYVAALESIFNEITSPFSRELSSKYESLSPTEIRVSKLVKEGKKSNEIAEMMDLSIRTVEAHRLSIREKLGIKGKGNLRSSLLSVK